MNRKTLLMITIAFFSMLFFAACGKAAPEAENNAPQPRTYADPDWDAIPDPLPRSVKGYEMFSWQGDADWVFTLISGTNRNKSFDELTSAENIITEEGIIKITVTGLEGLEQLFKRLPGGEEVFWGGINLGGQVNVDATYFTYPPPDVMQQVLRMAEDAGVTITTLGTQEDN